LLPVSRPGPETLALVRDGFMTVRETALFLRIAQSSVYALMSSGVLAFAKFNRSRRIPTQAVLDFAARNMCR
jgi:excisionase family DNA binding protein